MKLDNMHILMTFVTSQHQIPHEHRFSRSSRAGNQIREVFHKVQRIHAGVLEVVPGRQTGRVCQRVPVVGQRDKLRAGRLFGNTGNIPRSRTVPRLVHPLNHGLDTVITFRGLNRRILFRVRRRFYTHSSVFCRSGQRGLEFQNTLSMIHQSASLDSRLGQDVRSDNVKRFSVREHLRQFQRQRGAEILRHTAGNFLHTDSARRHQKIYAVRVAFLDNPRHLRLVAFICFFVKTAVVVNDN